MGWYSPEYHIMSWALSCLQLRKYYNNITLYADTVSSKLLIDTLQLPYSNVVCNLDELNIYHDNLWAIPKLYAYSLQEQPFLHVDGDVFIWKPFDEKLLNSDIIAQNKEAGTDYYENILNNLENKLSYFPAEIKYQRKVANPIYAFNMGIFGGHDISFFKEYTSKAFEFVNNNIECLSKINVSNFNIFFEQYLLYCLTSKGNKNVSLLLDTVIDDLSYTGFGDFVDVPHYKQYLHLIGTFKRNREICNQMAFRLRKDYPTYYYRIVQLFRDNKLPLKKDYYHSLTEKSESELVERFNFLKGKSIEKVSAAPVKKTISSFWRTGLIIAYLNETNTGISKSTKKKLINDVSEVENCIQEILTNKFSHLNNDFLYKRDILSSGYFENIFTDVHKIYDVNLVSNDDFEIIEACYDWTLLEDNESSPRIKVQKIIESCKEKGNLVIIPECDSQGYSMVNIDDLDLFLLSLLKKPLLIKALFKEIATAFDKEELKSAYDEFKLLIFGRIKSALLYKLIKPLI